MSAGARLSSGPVTYRDGCFSCENDRRLDELPLRERIAVDAHWRVAHATGTALPGWLVLLPRRHVTSLAALSDAEAATLGTWQVRLSRALHEVTGCVKSYIAQFAEAEGFAHAHIHVVPRARHMPAELRGPGVFGLLGVSPERQVSATAMDAIAGELAARL